MYCLGLVFRSQGVVKFSHLVDGDSLSIFAILGADVAPVGLIGLAHFFVAAAHGIPHSGIFGS